jgi:hypothetical protein
MMRKAIFFLAVAALTMPAEARLVGPGFSKSWGKAGVSLDQYRADAITCGREAAATDLRNSGPAKALVLASRLIENAPDIFAASVAWQMAAPDHNIPKAGDLLQARLDRCLIARGYRLFKLTAGQRHRLSRLPTGSMARHAYLHSLASDARVLER